MEPEVTPFRLIELVPVRPRSTLGPRVRRHLSRIVLLLLLAALCGCMPSVSRIEAEELVAARASLLAHPEGDIPAAAWPEAVTRFKPRRVYRDHAGIYLYTYEFFVERKGVFILDPASNFIPTIGDPHYDVVITDVYLYRSAG